MTSEVVRRSSTGLKTCLALRSSDTRIAPRLRQRTGRGLAVVHLDRERDEIGELLPRSQVEDGQEPGGFQSAEVDGIPVEGVRS